MLHAQRHLGQGEQDRPVRLCGWRGERVRDSVGEDERPAVGDLYILMAYIAMAYVVMAYIAMAYILMAYIAMADVVMA